MKNCVNQFKQYLSRNAMKAIMIAVAISSASFVQAQYGRVYGGNGGYGQQPPQYPRNNGRQQNYGPFQPTVGFSLSYAYPNADANQLYQFNRYDQGKTTSNGRVNAALDFRFTRTASLGLMASYGKVSAPYYSYNNFSDMPDMTGSLESFSVMLNYQQYFQTGVAGSFFSPYMRTAIGFNSWSQDYRDATGAKLNYSTTDLPVLAYQASIGADLKLGQNTSFFIEAGYGKYLLNAGLSFKNPLGKIREQNNNNRQQRRNYGGRNY
ncbi:MAG: porin family protein [Chitinophagaceae bacterium]|nr:porin family protein [Chitinophagaceae bacterium]